MRLMFDFGLACKRFFLISDRLKLVKNQTNGKQYPQAWNYSINQNEDHTGTT